MENIKNQELARDLNEVLKFDTKKLNEILNYIKTKPKFSFIYPKNLAEKFSLSVKDCFELLNLLENSKYVKRKHKIYCSKCNSFTSQTFATITDVVNTAYCDECEEKCTYKNNIWESVYVIYEVIKQI